MNRVNIKNVLERIPDVYCIQKLIEEINSDFYSTNCSGRVIDYNNKNGIIYQFVDNCKEEQLKKLCNRLEEEQKDLVKEFPLRKTDKVKDDTDFIFVNRKDELYKLRRFDSIQLCEISGCGRTHLLKKFKKEKEYEGWKVFFIELKKWTEEIIKRNNTDKDLVVALEDWLKLVGGYDENFEEVESNILLMIDDYDRVNSFDNEVKQQFNSYLIGCHKKIVEEKRGKFILSYIKFEDFDIPNEIKSGKQRSEQIVLTPLNESSIEELLDEKAKKKTPKRFFTTEAQSKLKRKIIEHVSFYSGGHPSIVVKLIDFSLTFYNKLLDENGSNYEEYKKNLEEIVNDTIKSILPKSNTDLNLNDLNVILQKTSVLKEFAKDDFVSCCEEEGFTFEKIKETRILSYKDGFFHIPLKELYKNSFLRNAPEKFKQINNNALEISKEYLKAKNNNKTEFFDRHTVFFINPLYYLATKYKISKEIKTEEFFEQITGLYNDFKVYVANNHKVSMHVKIEEAILDEINDDIDLNNLLSNNEIKDIRKIITKHQTTKL